MTRGFFAAAAAVAVVNAVVLAGVARNRSGPPEAVVSLDERELALVERPREYGGVALRLQYQDAPLDGEDAGWEPPLAPVVDQPALAALGFDCSVAPGDARAAAFYRRALPRPAFVVFTVGGPEWERRVAAWQEARRAWIDQQVAGRRLAPDAAARLRAEVDAAPERLSRLLPVAAGRDAEALRRLYPDRGRYLILRGVVRLHHTGAGLHGHLVEIPSS